MFGENIEDTKDGLLAHLNTFSHKYIRKHGNVNYSLNLPNPKIITRNPFLMPLFSCSLFLDLVSWANNLHYHVFWCICVKKCSNVITVHPLCLLYFTQTQEHTEHLKIYWNWKNTFDQGRSDWFNQIKAWVFGELTILDRMVCHSLLHLLASIFRRNFVFIRQNGRIGLI